MKLSLDYEDLNNYFKNTYSQKKNKKMLDNDRLRYRLLKRWRNRIRCDRWKALV